MGLAGTVYHSKPGKGLFSMWVYDVGDAICLKRSANEWGVVKRRQMVRDFTGKADCCLLYTVETEGGEIKLVQRPGTDEGRDNESLLTWAQRVNGESWTVSFSDGKVTIVQDLPDGGNITLIQGQTADFLAGLAYMVNDGWNGRARQAMARQIKQRLDA